MKIFEIVMLRSIAATPLLPFLGSNPGRRNYMRLQTRLFTCVKPLGSAEPSNTGLRSKVVHEFETIIRMHDKTNLVNLLLWLDTLNCA